MKSEKINFLLKKHVHLKVSAVVFCKQFLSYTLHIHSLRQHRRCIIVALRLFEGRRASMFMLSYVSRFYCDHAFLIFWKVLLPCLLFVLQQPWVLLHWVSPRLLLLRCRYQYNTTTRGPCLASLGPRIFISHGTTGYLVAYCH